MCSELIVTENQIVKIREFLNYTFTSVLRLQKYLTLFNPDASANSYLIVPTINGETNKLKFCLLSQALFYRLDFRLDQR